LESAIANGQNTPAIYNGLLQLLFELEPNQTTLDTILQINSQKRLTQLEDAIACEIQLTSIYQAPEQVDAIITLIDLSEHLAVILSSPQNGTYHHQLIAKIDRQQIAHSLRILDNVLPTTNLSNLDLDKFILQPAQQIYQTLILPIRDALPEKGNLLFVLDRSLETIPIPLLQSPSGYSLIDDYAISQTTIPYIYQSSTQQPTKILAAGVSTDAPSYQHIVGQLPPLPFVAQEIEFIQQLPLPHTILLNQDFTLQNLITQVETQRPSVIHIAAHGQFSSQGNLTYLTAYDQPIRRDNFRRLVTTIGESENPLDLLVLSACGTAQGDESASLGLAGIAVKAGAKSTLASLWVVNDRITALWMEAFYRAWLGGHTKAEALRQAQLEIRQTYPDPRLWAAFILVGSWT
jgi:CHAT domain-containing protein